MAQHVASRGSRKKRIIAVVLSVLGVLVIGVAAAGYIYQSVLASKIETIEDPFADITERPDKVTSSTGSDDETTEPVNILVLGSDSRISAGDPDQWEYGAQRTDVMMLAHISADRQSVTIMSFPRDSWVDVPGYGEAKINAAFSWGGPTLTIQTMENLTGVYIDHFMVTDFEAFAEMTDALGGVDITLKNSTTLAGQEFSAGTQHLNGEQALAYVRERKSLPRGDFDRVQRQQAWMNAIMHEVFAQDVLNDLPALTSFLDIVASSVAVDEGFTVSDMRDLAISARGVRADDVRFITVPYVGTGTSSDGQSIVLLDDARAATIFEAFANDTIDDYLEENPGAAPELPDVPS